MEMRLASACKRGTTNSSKRLKTLPFVDAANYLYIQPKARFTEIVYACGAINLWTLENTLQEPRYADEGKNCSP